ncbi:hypothetical protein [Clostridium sp. BNL1100]|uniref:BOW99_gp33 family protein n=1 Tax=Clostridium sp. BNL1100 TaxID=755731 RepID=UPI00024A729D|nr:hypothetical protein [Clostridium sp. BNL1100]AEY66342.1 hypothetical protein Clo1100_2157 [Clostridium sp. BNL1100]
MKKNTKINVVHILADGTVIEDISKAVIPEDHPIYDFLANVIMENLKSQEIEKRSSYKLNK